MFMTSLLLDILSQIFHQKKKKKIISSCYKLFTAFLLRCLFSIIKSSAKQNNCIKLYDH